MVAKHLVQRGICGVLEEVDVRTVNDVNMLHGVLDVEKPDKPCLPDVGMVLRLVMHLALCNVLLKALQGDMDKLPTAGLWQALSICEDE
eukprot:1525337-Karenia_brevis.AAC.1